MSIPRLATWVLVCTLAGCGPSVNRYTLIENSLRGNDPLRAASIVEQSEKEYGSTSRVLYGMDRGMTLHLAGQYQQSNAALEEAEQEVERLYTRRVRTEAAAFLTNDTSLPYEGDPYEQVMINVIKALNYAAMNNFTEALVEARRLDNRLNVIGDRAQGKDTYRDDGFARYLPGILYEVTGDLNNAFVAYRKAYEAYESAGGWGKIATPSQLKSDLLRVTDLLHLSTELDEYRRRFPDATWKSGKDPAQLAQLVVISYNGLAPRKEDEFLDVPISLDALQLVLLNRGLGVQSNRRDLRAFDSVLYGLNGRVVRVALPRLIPQKTLVAYDQVQLLGPSGTTSLTTEPAYNVTALAEKSLAERMPAITTKAIARAAVKFAAAEAATRGAQSAAGKDNAAWVGLLVGVVTKGLAVASEVADTRSWRTLPDEIHLARTWVQPGEYEVRVMPVMRQGGVASPESRRRLTLRAGETTFLIERALP
jgi:hypothetical protein